MEGSACQSYIPWFELLETGFFGTHQSAVQGLWEKAVLAAYLRESACMQACPGDCGMVAVVPAPPTAATNIAHCSKCEVGL